MKRKIHTAEFKAKVALEAVKSGLTANQIASKLRSTGSKKSEQLSKPAGEPGAKERVVYDKPIGQYYDQQNKAYETTNTGIIHYSKQGVHIVPGKNQP